MKNLLSLTLSLLLCFSLAACGGQEAQEVPVSEPESVPASAPAEDDIDEALDTIESVTSELFDILDELSDEEPAADSEQAAPAAPENVPADSIRPDFKEAMDSYEAFYDEYCEFMKDYAADPSNLDMLMTYTELSETLLEMDEKFEAWESEDMTDAEFQYYTDVQLRVLRKLSDAAA